MDQNVILRTVKVGGFNKDDVFAEMDRLNQKINSLEDELAQTKVELEDAKKKSAKPDESAINNLKKELEAAKSKAAADTKAITDENAKLKKDLETVSAEKAKLASERAQLLSEKQALVAEKSKLESEITALKNGNAANAQANANAQAAGAKVEELSGSVNALQLQIKSKDTEIANKDAEIKALKENVAKLEKDLEEANNSDSEALDLGSVFIEAKRTADKIVKDAKAHAEKTTSEANEKAEKTIAEANEKAEKTIAEANEEAIFTVNDAKEMADATINDANKTAKETVDIANERAEKTILDANRKAKYTVKNANIKAEEIQEYIFSIRDKLQSELEGIASSLNAVSGAVEKFSNDAKVNIELTRAALDETGSHVSDKSAFDIDFEPAEVELADFVNASFKPTEKISDAKSGKNEAADKNAKDNKGNNNNNNNNNNNKNNNNNNKDAKKDDADKKAATPVPRKRANDDFDMGANKNEFKMPTITVPEDKKNDAPSAKFANFGFNMEEFAALANEAEADQGSGWADED